jgi:hypothetical protein
MQIENNFRSLTRDERALIEKMLSDPFPGRDELRSQLEVATAKRIDREGSLALHVSSGPLAAAVRSVPTEAWCPDRDGVMIRLLLHIRNGRMFELEMYKDDGTEIQRAPTARDILLPAPGPG